jgi:hypothetical protein
MAEDIAVPVHDAALLPFHPASGKNTAAPSENPIQASEIIQPDILEMFEDAAPARFVLLRPLKASLERQHMV